MTDEKSLWIDCVDCECPKCKGKRCEHFENDKGDYPHYCKDCSERWVLKRLKS